MDHTFFQAIYNHPLISTADFNSIMQAHEKVKFTKGDVFLKYGQTANAYYLVETGLLRAFVTDYSGNEITTAFFSPNEISIEISSFFQRIATQENIIAVTSGNAYKIDFAVFQSLFERSEGFREWGRSWMSNQLFIAKQRAVDIITKTATERYWALMAERPTIIQKAPIKLIASYLGIADTSLSRIRKEVTLGQH